MKFVFADSLDFVDPTYDFETDRSSARRLVHRDDEFPHEYMDVPPYDGILVSRAIVGDARFTGKYSEAQLMRFRREGARKFLRYSEDRFPGSMLMGDCGAYSYRNMSEPPYRPEDTVEFYADGRFTHGCSVDHLIFDFDDTPGRRKEDIPEETRVRYDLTLQLAAEFVAAAGRIGSHFTPLGVVQGWSAESMATAAAELTKMGYDYLALGGTVALKIEQVERALAAIRDAIGSKVRLHLLGFGKIEHLAELKRYRVASFDTTSPLRRAFKDARKNYWMRDPDGRLSYYTAIRIPQATENNKLKQKALQGLLNQEHIRELEGAALLAIRSFAKGQSTSDDALDRVMAYWSVLNWKDEASPARREISAVRQRQMYHRTLTDRPWERCDCRVCREAGIEALIFRSSNRNRRRGMHNLHVFYRHLQEFKRELT